MAKAIMIQGTMSSVGKSLLTAALCRIFKQDGYRVAPFKSQNMASNSYITPEGLEMSRAQAMQAEAAGLVPSVLMNPIMLKPTSDVGSQVIVNGKVLGNMRAAEYFDYKRQLVSDILHAFQTLSEQNDIIVIEGAGGPAEINLKADDIVNMGMAKMAKAPVLLVGDIDRGGVFASLYGTLALLDPDEQELIKGVVINKFRGDVEILRPGLTKLEELIHRPVLGVVPHLHLDIEDEDVLTSRLDGRGAAKLLDYAVIHLPHMTNFTDFNPLERFPGSGVRYVRQVSQLGSPDLIFLPGTEGVTSDLLWLRQSGLETEILKQAAAGIPIIGISGGYQMLGNMFHQTNGDSLRGLGLLPVETFLSAEEPGRRVSGKISAQEGFFAPLSGCDFEGYVLSGGKTRPTEDCPLPAEVQDGFVRDNVLGTYAHGLFENGSLAEMLTKLLLEHMGLTGEESAGLSYAEYKQQQFDLLADGVRRSLDMTKIYEILETGV